MSQPPLPFDLIRASKSWHQEYRRNLTSLSLHGFDTTKGPPERDYLYWMTVYSAWARATWIDSTTGGKGTSLADELSKSASDPDFEIAARSVAAARWPDIGKQTSFTRASLLMPQIRESLRHGTLKDALRRFKDHIFAASAAADEDFFRKFAHAIFDADRRERRGDAPLRWFLVDLWLPLGLWKLKDDGIRARMRAHLPKLKVDAAKIKTARAQKPRLFSSAYKGK